MRNEEQVSCVQWNAFRLVGSALLRKSQQNGIPLLAQFQRNRIYYILGHEQFNVAIPNDISVMFGYCTFRLLSRVKRHEGITIRPPICCVLYLYGLCFYLQY